MYTIETGHWHVDEDLVLSSDNHEVLSHLFCNHKLCVVFQNAVALSKMLLSDMLYFDLQGHRTSV